MRIVIASDHAALALKAELAAGLAGSTQPRPASPLSSAVATRGRCGSSA